VVNVAGEVSGSFHPFPGDVWQLKFSPGQATSPFTRMLLLGAVVALAERAS